MLERKTTTWGFLLRGNGTSRRCLALFFFPYKRWWLSFIKDTKQQSVVRELYVFQSLSSYKWSIVTCIKNRLFRNTSSVLISGKSPPSKIIVNTDKSYCLSSCLECFCGTYNDLQWEEGGVKSQEWKQGVTSLALSRV